MSLLSACLLVLNLVILPSEASILFLSIHSLFDEVLRSVFAVDTSGEVFGWALDDSAGLREVGDFGLGGLLVMSVGIEDGAHGDELKIALEDWGQGCSGEVEPLVSGVDGFGLKD